MDALSVAEQLVEYGVRNVRAVLPDGRKIPLRLFKSTTGAICYFGKGKKRYGDLLVYLHPLEIHPILSRKSMQKKWEDGWKKVREKLVASGLWSDIIAEIDLAFKLGYDTMTVAYKEYWDTPLDKRVEVFLAKYPLLVAKNDEGKDYIRCTVLWNYSKLPKVKKMRFSSYNNDAILQRIQSAMDASTDYSTHGRVAYDVSFSYNASRKTATYSEEYRGCGNGHYYIALDSTHALHVEDD